MNGQQAVKVGQYFPLQSNAIYAILSDGIQIHLGQLTVHLVQGIVDRFAGIYIHECA